MTCIHTYSYIQTDTHIHTYIQIHIYNTANRGLKKLKIYILKMRQVAVNRIVLPKPDPTPPSIVHSSRRPGRARRRGRGIRLRQRSASNAFCVSICTFVP